MIRKLYNKIRGRKVLMRAVVFENTEGGIELDGNFPDKPNGLVGKERLELLRDMLISTVGLPDGVELDPDYEDLDDED